MLKEGRELLAERPGVLLAQVGLVLRAAAPEPDRLICRAPVKVVFQRDGYLRSHRGLPDRARVSAPCRSTVLPRSPHRRPLPGPFYEGTRPRNLPGGPPPALHTAGSAASSSACAAAV
jgi:hypothetical protein